MMICGYCKSETNTTYVRRGMWVCEKCEDRWRKEDEYKQARENVKSRDKSAMDSSHSLGS